MPEKERRVIQARSIAPLAAAATLFATALAACGGDDEGSSPEPAAAPTTTTSTTSAAAADLGGVKDYLLEHTDLLTGFAADFQEDAQAYHDLAEAAGFDYEALWSQSATEVGPLLERMKSDWIEGNPYYERMEGVVAGTPSLAEYDVILDAGSSAAEDPESAVPFDLELSDGTVLEQPGNLYNLTEGALWGTVPDGLPQSTPADLDGDGATEFGEALPDARFLLASAQAFDRYAGELAAAGEAWEPTESDAFTALVVMVPTMSEYFGQWKESRFVLGDSSEAESFNVVSRLSDINDILTGLEVIYAGVEDRLAEVDPAQAEQTGRELADLRAYVEDLYARESSGDRFAPEQADVLGTEAQDRATAIAGQVSQAAAELGVAIEQ
jgi:Imelysin